MKKTVQFLSDAPLYVVESINSVKLSDGTKLKEKCEFETTRGNVSGIRIIRKIDENTVIIHLAKDRLGRYELKKVSSELSNDEQALFFDTWNSLWKPPQTHETSSPIIGPIHRQGESKMLAEPSCQKDIVLRKQSRQSKQQRPLADDIIMALQATKEEMVQEIVDKVVASISRKTSVPSRDKSDLSSASDEDELTDGLMNINLKFDNYYPAATSKYGKKNDSRLENIERRLRRNRSEGRKHFSSEKWLDSK